MHLVQEYLHQWYRCLVYSGNDPFCRRVPATVLQSFSGFFSFTTLEIAGYPAPKERLVDGHHGPRRSTRFKAPQSISKSAGFNYIYIIYSFTYIHLFIYLLYIYTIVYGIMYNPAKFHWNMDG